LSTRAEFLERFSGSANHNFKLKSVAIYNSFDATILGIALELRRGPKVEFRK
jgi:DNA polymerase/3'-5' exonuclease PolX